MEGITCTACRILLKAQEDAKSHYKSEFHTYNLKRKLVQLEPVSEETFLEKKMTTTKLHQSTLEFKCALCNSTFRSKEKFDKHSSTHRDQSQLKPELPYNSDLTCLFCNKSSLDIQDNLKHMMVSHGFFIPDVEFVINLSGLIEYLHERIRIGLLCLYCDNRGSHQFRDFLSLQQHMVDKQHCFINSEEQEEYSEFYEYPTDTTALVKSTSEVTPTGELRLENGTIIGNKEYARYYKQYFRPRNQRDSEILAIMAEEYKSLPVQTTWATTDDFVAKELSKQRKELAQGLKNNMLKHHFRRQNPR
jgi:pre-60S factor REI1